MAVMDEAAIDEQYGLKPIQIIDLKGLMGIHLIISRG